MKLYGTTHHHQKKKKKRTFEIRNVATQSPNKRVLSYTIRAKKQNYSLDRGRAVARRQLPTPKIECFRNMLPLIFQTERVRWSEPVGLLSCPPSSLHSCFSLLPNAHKSTPDGNSQRPLRRCWGGTLALSPSGLVGPQSLAAGDSLPLPTSPRTTAPPPASRVASRPSSHTLSIRCVYFLPDSRHIWSTYSGYSSATRHIPQDHFSGCYGDLPPSSDFQVA